MVTLFDHVLVIAIAALFPVVGRLHFRRMVDRIAAGGAPARLRTYWMTIARQWIVVAVLGSLWIAHRRGWDDLGFRWSPSTHLWLGIGFTALVIVALVVQRRMVLRDARNRERYQAAIESLEALVPHDRRELATFSALSLTAGISEEILYRGYVIWYLGHAVGLGWAALGSAVVFGAGHAYQGVSGFLKTGAVGLIMAGLYLLTGSVLVPILLHAATDFIQGATAFAVIQRRDEPGRTSDGATASDLHAGRTRAGGDAG